MNLVRNLCTVAVVLWLAHFVYINRNPQPPASLDGYERVSRITVASGNGGPDRVIFQSE